MHNNTPLIVVIYIGIENFSLFSTMFYFFSYYTVDLST